MRRLFKEYPQQFWLLMGASFIDRVGGALVFTFFALYVTDKFEVGLTQVGGLFAIFAVTGMVGGVVGGALADRMGRKSVVVFGLVMSALSSVALGLVNDFLALHLVTIAVGLMSSVSGPAQQAMVADMLPEEQHAEGYGIWRVVINIAVVIGPVIGGLLADYSYLLLFFSDAVTSIITAVIILVALAETQSQAAREASQGETMGNTLRGYKVVLRDGMFMTFVLATMVAQLVYFQMYATLPVFLRDTHGVPARGFGYIMSMNATMVVFMQFWVSRRVGNQKPLLMMALGCVFYIFGFGMYGFVGAFSMFLVAMALITIGEMIFFPVAMAMVSNLAPEAMRGRYMAMFGFAFAIPSGVGTWVAGLVIDNGGNLLFWYLTAFAAGLATLMYLGLHRIRSDSPVEDGGAAPVVVGKPA